MRVIPAVGKVMTKPEAARFLGVTEKTVENYVRFLSLPRLQIGGRVFFRPSDLKTFAALKTTEKPAQSNELPRIDNAASKSRLRRMGYDI